MWLLSVLAPLLTAAALQAQPASVVRALLDDAAERYDVPRELLYGVAFNESRWRNLPGERRDSSCNGMPLSIGIMGLHDDDYFGHSIESGDAIGTDGTLATVNMAANIRVGAHYLSTLFDGTDRHDLRSWITALGEYSGIPASQPELRLLYADGVFELLRRGWYADDQYVAPAAVPVIDRAALKAGLERMGVSAVGEDYPDAEWRPSPNFSSRNGTPITAIAIHDTEGNFAGSISWLISPEAEASAHYIIRSVDGYVVQLVAEKEKAWHVRTENPYSIGIEHEGYVSKPEFFTPSLYHSSAKLVRFLTRKHHIPLDRTHVKGHIDFPNNTHTDPGGWWDWPGYFRMIDNAPNERVVLDPFEDNVVGWWQPEVTGSTLGIDTAETAFDVTASAAETGTAGGLLSYAFTSAAGGVVRVFRSGHGNTSDGLLNVGASGYVTLRVRGDGSGNELELWFYDADRNNIMAPVGRITGTGWRTVSVPVTSLGSNGPYRFHSIVVRQASAGSRSRVIAFDDLAHETVPLGVEAELPVAEVPARLAIRAGDALPASLGNDGGIRITSLPGTLVASFERLPSAAVGTYLNPGCYAVETAHHRALVMIVP